MARQELAAVAVFWFGSGLPKFVFDESYGVSRVALCLFLSEHFPAEHSQNNCQTYFFANIFSLITYKKGQGKRGPTPLQKRSHGPDGAYQNLSQ